MPKIKMVMLIEGGNLLGRNINNTIKIHPAIIIEISFLSN
jgi:hypothetical protein